MRPGPPVADGSGGRCTGSWLVLVLLLLCTPFAESAPRALEALAKDLRIDAGAVSVSGVSSGAYMAAQLHIAHSDRLIGAGIIAGGPYACALGRYPPYSWLDVTGLYAATSRCSDTNPWWFFQGPPELAQSRRHTRALARDGRIAGLSGLDGDRVWLLSGGEDTTVPAAVVEVAAAYYRELLAPDAVKHVHLARAGHGMVVTDGGGPCEVSEAPYLNDCDLDAAGALLAHLHGALEPRRPADPAALLAFRQAASDAGLGPQGWVYRPRDCVRGARCALHIALHGCRQGAGAVGRAFVDGAGYNGWAEANRIVVLYPQVQASVTNPRGCWDWWGYTSKEFLVRDGAQIAALASMMDTLLARSPGSS